MTMIPDNVLRTECFQVLVDKFGYLDTERFVVMMSKSPMDYTTRLMDERSKVAGSMTRGLDVTGQEVRLHVVERQSSD